MVIYCYDVCDLLLVISLSVRTGSVMCNYICLARTVAISGTLSNVKVVVGRSSRGCCCCCCGTNSSSSNNRIRHHHHNTVIFIAVVVIAVVMVTWKR